MLTGASERRLRSGGTGTVLCAGLLSGLLAGCAAEHQPPSVGHRPARIVRTQLRQLPTTTQAAQGPLTVERAIREALAASPRIAEIYDRIDAAAAQVRQAEAAFYPRVILGQDFSATNNPMYGLMYVINQRRATQGMDFNNMGQQQNAMSSIEGQWSLFEGGARWHNRQAAVQERRSVEADLQAARNQLVGAVIETYYRWLQASELATVAQRAVDVAEADEKLAADRLEAQMLLKSELLRLKTNRAEAQGNLVTARNAVRKWQAALERLLARPILPDEVPAASNPPVPALPPGGPDALVEQALEQRPELAAVEALIAAARARVKAAEGGRLPQIAGHAEYEWNSWDLTHAQGSWVAGVQLTWNIFDGGLTPARIRAARARLREMTNRGQQLALDIALEVHQAAIGVEDAVAKIKVATEQKQSAEEGLQETQQLYQNQVVTVDALLQAELAWNRAEVAYSAAVFDGKIAEAALRQALGELADWTGEPG